MAELTDHEVSLGPLGNVIGVGILVAAIAIPYMGERAYRRWLKKSDLLAGFRAGLKVLRTGYEDRLTNMSDVAHIIGDVVVEVDRISARRRR